MEHKYKKEELVKLFDSVVGKTLEEIDTKMIFENVKEFNNQKGVIGNVIEQCILGYEPDTKQEADLLIFDGKKEIHTELKSTGLKMSDKINRFIAKEPMSITGVGIFEITNQYFENSHFWDKLEHMLIVYYHYKAEKSVKPYEYRLFPIVSYDFHEFDEDDTYTLKQDWENVQSLVKRVLKKHPNCKEDNWENNVKQEYIRIHGELRKQLSYIDLAPVYPPRFRLKKPVVSNLVAKHFGYPLEKLPDKYIHISDIDRKCQQLTNKYAGKTVAELANLFEIILDDENKEIKNIAEKISVAMFGGKSSRLNEIEIFEKFGLIAKTFTTTDRNQRTEDMKLFLIDFEEMTRLEVVDEENGGFRDITFEDSELYAYFTDYELLCILFEEPKMEFYIDKTSRKIISKKHSLALNKFCGFRRLVFSDSFIDTVVRKLWGDTRDKIINNKLKNVISYDKNGLPKIIKSGDVSCAPNFLKSSENAVFVRGSGTNSSDKYKTESVNNIKMLPQYVWIKGSVIVEQLNESLEI